MRTIKAGSTTFVEDRVPEATRVDAHTVKIPPLGLYTRSLGSILAATVCYDLYKLGVPARDLCEIVPRIDPGWDLGRVGSRFDLAWVEYHGRAVIRMYCDDGLTAAFVQEPVDPRASLIGGNAADMLGVTRWQ